jgi:hypothetical protein
MITGLFKSRVLRAHFQAKWTPVRVKKMRSLKVWTRLFDPSGSKNALAALAIVASTYGSGAMAQAPTRAAAPRPAGIDRNGVIILIRSTLMALDQANKTGNYTVLRDLGAPAFRANTAARLAEIFAKQRADNLDLSGIAAIDPQLSLLPQIEANDLLHMTGFFPSIPAQVNFDLAYAPVDGQWRLFGLSVALGQAAPAAPTPPPVAAAPPAAAAKPAPAAKKKPATAARKPAPAAKPGQ